MDLRVNVPAVYAGLPHGLNLARLFMVGGLDMVEVCLSGVSEFGGGDREGSIALSPSGGLRGERGKNFTGGWMDYYYV